METFLFNVNFTSFWKMLNYIYCCAYSISEFNEPKIIVNMELTFSAKSMINRIFFDHVICKHLTISVPLLSQYTSFYRGKNKSDITYISSNFVFIVFRKTYILKKQNLLEYLSNLFIVFQDLNTEFFIINILKLFQRA